jgi:drug/metabolite transporter (DMT)-like permease
MKQDGGQNLINWVIFIILSIIWGSSFILMKEGMKALSAYQVASLRIFSAGAILVPVAVKNLGKVDRKDIPYTILSGLLGSFFPAYLFCIAETKLDSGIAGILNALTPLFTVVLGVAFFGLQPSIWKWIGILTGLAGLMLLIVSGSRDISFNNISYAGFILIATVFYGLNVNMVSKRLKHIPSITLAAIAFSTLVIPALAILGFTGYFSLDLSPDMVYSTAASAVLGIFGTAIASILFYMLMKRAGALFASMVTYGIPFVALAWGYLAGEQITSAQLLCLGLILAGVYVARR